MNNLKIFLLFFLILVETVPVANANTQLRNKISNVAEELVREHITANDGDIVEIKSHPIDERVRINDCDQPLDGKITSKSWSKNQIVKIACNSSTTPWQLFVQVRVKHMTKVLVAKNALDKGSLVDNKNIELALKDKSSLRQQVYQDITPFIGAKTKRKISAGQIISLKNICFVCKGERVTIEAKSETLSIKAAGIALADGSFGDTIRVRNQQSGKVVEARVVAVNRLIINL